jgi:NhaP-type Na+/H+ or K+/H+ antiporter
MIGLIAGGTLRWAAREILETTSLLTVSLALSLSVIGVAELLGTSGVLAAFVAGWPLTRRAATTPKSGKRSCRRR